MKNTKSIAEYRWEDLTVGKTEKFDVLLTGELVDHYADCSGDRSPIHTSIEEAKRRGFSKRVAHGMLLGGLLSQFVGCRIPGRFGMLLSANFKFHHPCLEGDLVEVEGTIESLSAATQTISMNFQFRVLHQVRTRATALVSLHP